MKFMYSVAKFYSQKDGEIFNFLTKYYNNITNLGIDYHSLEWKQEFPNPVEMATMLGIFADNIDSFELAMWISIDKGVYINITPNNADSIIRYLYERYPY